MGPKKHAHGSFTAPRLRRLSGPTEYGEWFGTEAALRAAMREVARTIGSRYYCEAKTIGCAECEVDESPKVIAAL